MPERYRVRAIIYAVAAVAIAATGSGMSSLRAAPVRVPMASESPARKVFELTLTGGKVAGIGNTIKVRKGDQIELRWISDRSVTLHLHGYDIEAKVAPHAPAAMIFKASLAGRFPVSEHRHGAEHHRAVLYLEVHP